MAIEDIFRALEEQAESECQDVLASAREQADAIVAEAQAEADRIKRERVELATASARQRGTQVVNAAKLQNRKDLGSVRDRSVERAFEMAGQRLASFREQPTYDTVFAALADEALRAVEGYEDRVLVVASDDEQRAASMAAGRASVEATLEVATGVVVSAQGGRITASNTLEDRLAKVRRNAASHVAEMLFE